MKTFNDFANSLQLNINELPEEAVTVMEVGFNYLQAKKQGVDSE